MTPQEFEARTGLTAYQAAHKLGVTKSKWYEWRQGVRPVPRYIRASMAAHAALADADLPLPTDPD